MFDVRFRQPRPGDALSRRPPPSTSPFASARDRSHRPDLPRRHPSTRTQRLPHHARLRRGADGFDRDVRLVPVRRAADPGRVRQSGVAELPGPDAPWRLRRQSTFFPPISANSPNVLPAAPASIGKSAIETGVGWLYRAERIASPIRSPYSIAMSKSVSKGIPTPSLLAACGAYGPAEDRARSSIGAGLMIKWAGATKRWPAPLAFRRG
jgi:hypothetical protein